MKNQSKKKKSVTLSDIAELAKVSKAVASEVLRNSPRAERFSSETVDRVRAAAEELSFKGNFFAAQMHVAKRKLVMVYSSHFKDIYAAEIIESFSAYLNQQGYQVFNASLNTMQNVDKDIVTVCGQHGFNAVAFVGEASAAFSDPNIKKLIDDQVTVVSIGRKVKDPRCQQILFDFEHAFKTLTNHYRSKGITNVSIVSNAHKKNSPLHQRVLNFEETIQNSGLTLNNTHHIKDQKDITRLIDKTLENYAKPTVLACMADPLAWSIEKQLQDRNIHIGHDIFITGLNDNSPSEYFSPSITTIALPMSQMGRLGAMTLLDAYEREELASATTLLQGKLILRESCP